MVNTGQTVVEDVFYMLNNRRRRFAIFELARSDDALTVSDLAEQIAAWENGVLSSEVTSTQRKRVYNSLQQTHLPKLAERGFIEYDEREGTIEPTEQIDQLDIYVEIVEGREIPWSKYYLGLATVGLLLVVAKLVGVAVVSGVPLLGMMIGFMVVFAGSSLVHVGLQRSYDLTAREKPPEVRN